MSRRPRALVVGEDRTDADALKELVLALCPGLRVKSLVAPLRLRRGNRPAIARLDAVLALIQTEHMDDEVHCVFADADADALAPDDAPLVAAIQGQLSTARMPVHAVVPVWELESWWFLWPQACTAVVPSWRAPTDYVRRDVDRIEHSKEALRQALRPRDGRSVGDYRPRDGPRIAAAVRAAGTARSPRGTSASYDRFRAAVASCCP